jgi:predicted transcriptional regulator
MPQRDRYDIVKDILEIIYDTEPLYRNQMNQTRIGCEANLIHPQVVRSLKELVGLGLLTRIDFKPYPYYEITTKGKRCLQLFGEIDDDLKPESTDL